VDQDWSDGPPAALQEPRGVRDGERA
jgi:hypothetical protein